MESRNLSVKYVFLYKIRVAKWAPFFHGSSIIPSLIGMLYQVGNHDAFDFGEYVFKKFMKHVESYVVKLPIVAPQKRMIM